MVDRRELLDEVRLPSSKGRRKAQLGLEFVRELTEEDLPKLESSEGAGLSAPAVRRLRHSHHQLAQVLAKGVEETEASAITGYSRSYISILKHDPSFSELMASYERMRDEIFVRALERMNSLGLSSLDELQARLEEDPQGWSRRELMELAELCLVKPQRTPSGGAVGPGGSGGGVNVEIKFVEASAKPPPQVEIDVVDLEFEDESR